MDVIAFIFLGLLILLVLIAAIGGFEQTPEQRKGALAEQQFPTYGPVNPAMICPHCQSRGSVHTREVRLKKGISGGKATAALLTAGVSVLATGLSRKEKSTQAFCAVCKNTWSF